MQQPSLRSVDSQIWSLSKRFVVELKIIRGSVDRLGTLEKSRTLNTQNSGYTIGKIWPSGFIGAREQSHSTTNEVINKSISLLKIGDNVLVNLQIPSTGVYEALTPNADVACVASADLSRLYYVANHSEKLEIGIEPDLSGLISGKWLCIATGGFILWNTASTMARSVVTSHSLLALVGGTGLLVAGRGLHLALQRSREIWRQAVKIAQQP